MEETVGTAETLMGSMTAEVTYLISLEQHITTAIKDSIDFEWIRCTGCSLHNQRIVLWYCDRSHRNLHSLVV
jgi:hypothetical protein